MTIDLILLSCLYSIGGACSKSLAIHGSVEDRITYVRKCSKNAPFDLGIEK